MRHVQEELWLRTILDAGVVRDHILHEVLLWEVGIPLQTFKNPRQAVTAIFCALQGTHLRLTAYV
jgi:hypothetical protein